jgi:hypothetical protein
MVVVAVFLEVHMARRIAKRSDLDYVCGYCLFFQPQQGDAPSLRSGNCVYHKEWIENAYRTTCSDMSNQSLQEQGIYKLIANEGAGWNYIRRTEKIRTRLYAVK